MEKINQKNNINKKMKIPTLNIPQKNSVNKSNLKTSLNDSKNKETEKDTLNKIEKLQNLNKIFLNNSQYNTKEKDYFMNWFQIIEILKKGKIISKGIISKTQADIILTQLNPYKRKYNLIDFINFLIEICHYIFKDAFEIAPKETMNYFLNCYLIIYMIFLKKKIQKIFWKKIMKTHAL